MFPSSCASLCRLEIDHRDTLPTNGIATVTITGNNFGTAAGGVVITAAYGPTASEYVVSCSLSAQSIYVVHCPTQPGLGADLEWTVTVAGQISNVAPTLTSYDTLEFTKAVTVSGTGAVNGSTAGGQPVMLYPHNIGPLSFPPSIFAQYIAFYGATARVRGRGHGVLRLRRCCEAAVLCV